MDAAEAPPPSFKDLILEYLKEVFPRLKIDIYYSQVTGLNSVDTESYLFVNDRPCGRLTDDFHFIHTHIGKVPELSRLTYNVHVGDPSFFPQLVDSIRRTLNSPPNIIEEIDDEVIKAWTRRVNGWDPV